jgi:hypothetical protein
MSQILQLQPVAIAPQDLQDKSLVQVTTFHEHPHAPTRQGAQDAMLAKKKIHL